MSMKRIPAVLAILLLTAAAPAALAGDDAAAGDAKAQAKQDKQEKKEVKQADKRAEIDSAADEALDLLFEESPGAKQLYSAAYGYAVFSSLKVAVGVSGGGGSGVAVNKGGGERTYMKMGTAGVGLGLGGRKYQIVFLFENEKSFQKFLDSGWQADTSANATAGTAGAGVASTFSNGVAIYQLSEKGLMANADIAGTKYWKNDDLN